MNKYRAKPVTIDNIRFHSTAEGNRYLELKMLLRAGKIQQLELQPRFPLHAYKNSTPIGEYRADFAYWSNMDEPCRRIIEDVKGGPIPALSKWKIKHAEAQYHFKVLIIRMGRWKTGSGMTGNRQSSKTSKLALMKA